MDSKTPSVESKMEDDSSNKASSEETVENLERHKKTSLFPGFGIICAFLATIFYSLMTLFVKQLNDIHPVEVGLSRSYAQFILLIPFLTYKRGEVDIMGPTGLRSALWLQGTIGSVTVIFRYFAISKLPLGDAVTVTYLSLVFTPFLAKVILKETLTVFDIIFAVSALVGIVLISRPTFIFPVADKPPGYDIGVLYAVLSAVGQSFIMVILRLIRQVYPVLNMLYYCFCTAVVTTILLPILNEFSWPCWQDLPYLFAMGPLSICAQLLLVLALRSERAGTVGVLRSFQIIFVYILQVVVLKDIPATASLIGASLVFSSSVGIGVRKLINEKMRRTKKN